MLSDETGRLIVPVGMRPEELVRQLVEGARGGGFGEGLVETPVPALAALLEQREALLSAVTYLLNRRQIDPDFGYYLGWGTESFERLVRAEAAARGLEVGELSRKRARDLQPEHRKREPEVLELRARIEELERELAEATSL